MQSSTIGNVNIYLLTGSPSARLHIASPLQWHPVIKIFGISYESRGIWDGMWKPVMKTFKSSVEAARDFDFPLLEG